MHYALKYILSAENFYHLTAERIVYFKSALRCKLVGIGIEEIVLEEYLLYHHFGMEDVRLVDVNVNCVIFFERFPCDIVLNGGYFVVDEELFALLVTGKASYLIVYRYNIGVEASDKVVEGFQRSDLSAGGNVDINTERCDSVIGVKFGIGMHGKVALIEVTCYALLFNGRCHSVPEVAGFVDTCVFAVFVRDEERCRSTLRLIILF